MKPGRELDMRIAVDVMGWTKSVQVHPEMRAITLQDLYNDPSIPMPHYSTDIAAAWLVVEKFNQTMPKTWTFNLFGSGNDWHVEIDSNDGRFLQNGPSVQVFERAETVPLAICLAAMKVVNASPLPAGSSDRLPEPSR